MSLIALLIVGISTTNAQNLLQNPGFEITGNLSDYWCQNSCCTCFDLAATDSIVKSGSYSGLAANRTSSWNGPSQWIGSGHGRKRYYVSGYIQLVTSSSELVKQDVGITATYLEVGGGRVYKNIGQVKASNDEWRQIQNFYQFANNIDGDVRVYIQSAYQVTPFYDFLVDDLVIEEREIDPNWRDRANADIEQFRKRDVRLVLRREPAQFNASITQTRLGFPMGSAINYRFPEITQYRETFLENFNFAVIENEMKWKQNEPTRDQVDFTTANSILDLLDSNNILCRGHTMFWAAENRIQQWVLDLSADTNALKEEMSERIVNATDNFGGRIVSWDVNNEMLHNRWFRDTLQNESIPVWMFKEIRNLDANVELFLNDYNVLTTGGQLDAMLDQAADLISQGGEVQGLGVQGHFSETARPDYEILQMRLDRLATSGVPVWLSELDVTDTDVNSRAERLETVVRTAFAHPNVEGIMLWGFWSESHWRGADAALWDSDWTINAAGQRWQALLQEWQTNVDFDHTDLSGRKANRLDFRAFHGSYRLEVDGYQAIEFEVEPGTDRQKIVAKLTPQG